MTIATSHGYENAPATLMLATQCAVCGRPLVDAVSVETGMGPDCRERHGYYATVPEAARTLGNKIVHAIAAGAHTGPDLVSALQSLRSLGFDRLADTIAERQAGIVITVTDDGRLAVRTPFMPAAVAAWRHIPGRRWDKTDKVNTVPVSSRADLWALLRAYFPGTIGLGPKGAFLVS